MNNYETFGDLKITDERIQHAGVKGMKWGKSLFGDKEGSVTESLHSPLGTAQLEVEKLVEAEVKKRIAELMNKFEGSNKVSNKLGPSMYSVPNPDAKNYVNTLDTLQRANRK